VAAVCRRVAQLLRKPQHRRHRCRLHRMPPARCAFGTPKCGHRRRVALALVMVVAAQRRRWTRTHTPCRHPCRRPPHPARLPPHLRARQSGRVVVGAVVAAHCAPRHPHRRAPLPLPAALRRRYQPPCAAKGCRRRRTPLPTSLHCCRCRRSLRPLRLYMLLLHMWLHLWLHTRLLLCQPRLPWLRPRQLLRLC